MGGAPQIKPKEPIPLKDKLLPIFDDIQIDVSSEQLANRMILICFWDMNQRPSRNCILQLVDKAQEYTKKDVTFIAIQTSKVEDNLLKEWITSNNIRFPVGMIEGDEDQTKFNWGVRALPWLILTDKEHIVQAEGFGLDELEEKIKEIRF